MAKRKFWQGYEELDQNPEFEAKKHDEFKEQLPFASHEVEKQAQQTSPRRDFLKILGFSTAAAAVAASCEQPIRKIIPYVIKPEEIIPGVANYYASSFINGSDYCPIVVKTREGRPIKIEGNKMIDFANGGTDAKTQASVLGLYDNSRLRGPRIDGKDVDWNQIDTILSADLEGIAKKGGKIALLTSTIISPSTKSLIKEFKNKYTNVTHVQYEPVSKAGMVEANSRSFGRKEIPHYRFDKAKVIVSFAADFLNSWVSPIEFQAQYAKVRKISRVNPEMSKHIQFEATMSNTGSNADNRYQIKPSEEGVALIGLYNLLLGKSVGHKFPANIVKGLEKTAYTLKTNKGNSLVVSGSNDANIQVIVNAINSELGNYGNTIDFTRSYNFSKGSDAEMMNLVAQMEGGQIDAILINGVNPGYDYPEAKRFLNSLKRVPVTISFNDRMDETAGSIKYLVPDNHYLESWNDAEPKAGTVTLAQPVISNLFNTRQMQDTFMTWMGMSGTFYDYMKNYWSRNITSDFDKALHDGYFYASKRKKRSVGNTNINISNAVNAIAAPTNELEVVLYEGIIGNGKYTNNPILQEIPDPVTKIVWENFAAMSKKTAIAQGFKEGDLIKLSANNHSVELPVVFQPGQCFGTIAVAVGYGRTNAGTEYCNSGANVYPFAKFNSASNTFKYSNSKVTININGKGYEVAKTQTQHHINDFLEGETKPSDYDRQEQIFRDTSLAQYQDDRYAGNALGKKYKDPAYWGSHMTTLYNERPELQQGHHWGMAIDLNACTGCNACVAACNIENNIPVVGKEEVFRAHDMHWLRIDRYYFGHDDNPDVGYQPMLCQHCDNAPCENVCPVSATNHSSEGLNQMAYNRCIGTRYCANNCPFKVRRFNWFDYQGSDSFAKNTKYDNDVIPTMVMDNQPDTQFMADDLSRMVLNPDVTVRSRGVMEKCSFCVQRIQGSKLEAKKEGRGLKDGDVVTACQSACAAGAISFGDMNDKNSKVFKERALNERSFNLLEELHVMSSISYLTKVRNKDKSEMI